MAFAFALLCVVQTPLEHINGTVAATQLLQEGDPVISALPP